MHHRVYTLLFLICGTCPGAAHQVAVIIHLATMISEVCSPLDHYTYVLTLSWSTQVMTWFLIGAIAVLTRNDTDTSF